MAVLTTSGTSTFNQTAVELLTGALRIAQVIGAEETATGAQLTNGLESFNLLVKQLQASGVHVWLQEDVILFLQPGQYRYQLGAGSPDHACAYSTLVQTALTAPAAGAATTLTVASIVGIGNGDTIGVPLISGVIFWTTVNGAPSGTTVTLAAAVPAAGAASGALVFDYPAPLARPLKCSNARRYTYSSKAEIPLIPLSRLDFANISTKQAPGVVANYFFDPQTGQNAYSQLIAIFNVNPAPADDTIAVRFTAQRPIQDFANLTNLPDFPAEWLNALKWALAMEIAPEYGTPQEQIAIIQAIAQPKKEMLGLWDQEAQGTSTLPFTQPVYQVIARALRLCNAIGPQDVPSLGLVNNAFISFNAMIQEWQASGIHVWCEEECILFIEPAQPLYYLGGTTSDHATLWDTLIQTTLAADATAAATSLVLTSAAGIADGDNIGVQLDDGTNFWTTVDGAPSGATVTLTDALPSAAAEGQIVFDYTTPLIRPLRVYGGRRYNYASRIETAMLIQARLDYEAQPNKYTSGVMTSFFYDPQTSPTPFGSDQQGASQLNVWPNPADNTFGFRFTAQRPIQTLTQLTSAADFPVEWFNALCFNLAVDLWPEYGKERATKGEDAQPMTYQTVRILAQEKLGKAMGWDREPESIMFGVAMAPGYRRG